MKGRRGAFHAKRLFSKEGSGGLARDRGGAAMVEFAIAILPILITFLGMFQWGILAYIHLLVKHGAFIAARAEAVIHPHMPDSGPQEDVHAGVMMLFKHTPVKPEWLTIDPNLPAREDETLDTVTVKLDFKCGVPLGDWVACGASKHHKFSQTAAFPNQGSSYQKVWGL
jgi:TadE-like protein